MATWGSSIEVTDLAAKRVRVTATRTDGEDVWTHTVSGQVDTEDLAGTRDRINDRIWAAWEAYQTAETNKAAIISGYEAALTADLQAREDA